MTTSASWRRILRAAKAARNGAFLGPRVAARAAAEEVREAESAIRIAVACILAAQGSKLEFLSDLRTYWAELEAHDVFCRERGTLRVPMARRLPSRTERRDPLPVDIARAAPILELFQRYGHQLRRAGAEWTALCPFHDDTRPSLHVNASKGLWRCHACGAGGDGIAYVMQRKGLDFAAAVREVAA